MKFMQGIRDNQNLCLIASEINMDTGPWPSETETCTGPGPSNNQFKKKLMHRSSGCPRSRRPDNSGIRRDAGTKSVPLYPRPVRLPDTIGVDRPGVDKQHHSTKLWDIACARNQESARAAETRQSSNK